MVWMPKSIPVLLLTMFIPLWPQFTNVISHWFHKCEVCVPLWPPKSPGLNPLTKPLGCGNLNIGSMNVRPTNLQKWRDTIMSTWKRIWKECFQYLVESTPRRTEAVPRAKGGHTQCSVSVYLLITLKSALLLTLMGQKRKEKKIHKTMTVRVWSIAVSILESDTKKIHVSSPSQSNLHSSRFWVYYQPFKKRKT